MRRAGLALAALLAAALGATPSPAASLGAEESAAAWDREALARAVAAIDESPTGPAGIAWVAAYELVGSEEGAAGLERYRALAEDRGDDGYAVLAELSEAMLRIALLDPEMELRTRAVHAIEASGDHRFVDPLIGVLEHDPDAKVRGAGAQALRRLGGRESRAALRRALEHPSPQVVELAADQLARMNDNAARRFLRREARGGDTERRLWAAGMLVRLEDRAAIPVLGELVADPDPAVRLLTVEHLGDMGQGSVVPLVRPALDDDDAAVRFAAASTLAQLGEDDGVEILRGAAADGTKTERIRALRLLAELDDREALPLMREGLTDESSIVREQAALALLEMGDPEGKAFLEAQEESFGTLGAFAGSLMAGRRTTDEEPEAPLDVRAQDVYTQNRYARAADVKRLGKLGPTQVQAIRGVLRDPHPIPRAAALWALAEAGTRADVPAAIPLLADPDRGVRLDAAGAILHLLDR